MAGNEIHLHMVLVTKLGFPEPRAKRSYGSVYRSCKRAEEDVDTIWPDVGGIWSTGLLKGHLSLGENLTKSQGALDIEAMEGDRLSTLYQYIHLSLHNHALVVLVFIS